MVPPNTDIETPETKKQPEDQQPADPNEGFDREALESATKERLEAAFSDDAPEPEEDPENSPEEGPEDSPEDDPGDGDGEEEPENNTEESEGEEELDDEDEAAADDGDDGPSDAPTLPESHRRSLRAYGWQDDEIDKNLQTLGDPFLKTAERIHANRNAELQQWAAAGRQAREEQAPASPDDKGTKGQQQAQTGQLPSELKPIDAAKLKEQYGDDELVDAIVGPVNQTIEALNNVLPQVQQGQQAVQQSQVERVTQQVEGFFGQDDLKPYEELYGNPEAGMTEEQIENRNKVLDTAYNLMVGAEQVHGQELPFADALSHAHEVVSSGFKSTAARKTVKKQAKTRNRGLSQKPSRRKGSQQQPSDEPPETRDELERRTKERLAQAFAE